LGNEAVGTGVRVAVGDTVAVGEDKGVGVCKGGRDGVTVEVGNDERQPPRHKATSRKRKAEIQVL
jgi:hypothetical protein